MNENLCEAIATALSASRLHSTGMNSIYQFIETLEAAGWRLVPEEMVNAGMDIREKVRGDLDNYVSGVTIDWDDGVAECSDA